MKRVIKQMEQNTVPLNAANGEGKCYGFEVNKSKGFITADGFHGESIAMKGDWRLTHGDNWSRCRARKLIDCLTAILEMTDYLYEFDTAQELFAWLAKE